MQTPQPVLLYGRYEWDRDLQPVAEFEARVESVRRIMRDRGWDALVVHGDSRENAALCYLTNVVPNQRWGLALIRARQPVRVIASVGPRDLPAITRLTWVEDVRAARDAHAPLTQWLTEIGGEANRVTRIGVVDLPRMRADIGRAVTDACRGFGEVEDATVALSALRRAKSPQEIRLLRTSQEILQVALSKIDRLRKERHPVAAALIAGERRARLLGAQDVRSLCNSGGRGPLQPLSHASGLDPSEPWTVYLAVRYCGYWTEAVTVLGSDPSAAVRATRAAIERALALVRPGVGGRELREGMKCALGAYPANPMLGDKIGRALGLSLDAEAWITAASEDRLVENAAYVIMAGASDGTEHAFESAMVIVGRDQSDIFRPVTARLEHR